MIGQGTFGKVYIASDTQNKDLQVAVKAESLNCRFPQLLNEFQHLKNLAGKGYPKLIHQGICVEKDQIYMITQLLGPTLEDLFNFCGRKFSTKTTLMLFYQILERLEHMHGKGLVHRDLKPDNIMMGMSEYSDTVHLIDFGLCRQVWNPKTGKHIDFRTGKNLVGTARYVSINAHLGYELSMRDDLLTLGFVMVYLTLG